MKILKKTSGWLFVFILLTAASILLFPILTNAETSGNFTYTVLEDGTAEISGYYGPESDALEIPSEIDGYPVSSIGPNAFYYITTPIGVIIPSSVKRIAENAFAYSGLITISIPDSVTSIGESAFAGCYELKEVTIPSGTTDIPRSAFMDCHGLETIVVSPDNPKYDSRNNCNALIETETNQLLFGCKNSFVPNGVTSIGPSAFEYCGLSSITLPNSVTSIGEYAFANCSLTSITLPDSVTNFGYGAFSGCSALTSLTIPSGLTDNIGDIFSFCGNLENISVSPDNPKYDSRNNCNAIIETKTNQLVLGCKNTVIPNGVTGIADLAFSNCGFTDITIPESVTSIGFQAFGGCGLTSITLPNGVTRIENNAFDNCSELESISIPGSLTDISDEAFTNCQNLGSIIVSPDNPKYDSC